MPKMIEIPGKGRLRIYSSGQLLTGETGAPTDRIIVEWAGHTGHPSSYGLLGATPTDSPTHADLALDHEEREFPQSLAGTADQVSFGLLNEYWPAIASATSVSNFPITVRVAAHAQIGSSPIVFRRLANLLAPLVYSTNAERTDSLVRLLWEGAWTAP